MSRELKPINFMNWINENRHLFKPPVGNKLIWEDSEFLAFVVGGPNSRKDFHINNGEEFFYQIEGDMNLIILKEGKPHNLPIKEGEIFLLPPNIPHSPQRLEKTIGLVIERRRQPHEKDGLLWICDQCNHKLYDEYFHLKNIVTDLPPVFDRFYENKDHTACKKCGHKHERSK